MTELVGELLLHLEDLPRAGVVPESSRHLLVGHWPLVALPVAPECRHLVLVGGGKAEDAGRRRDPGHAVGHAWILQHLKEEVEETNLSACVHWPELDAAGVLGVTAGFKCDLKKKTQ